MAALTTPKANLGWRAEDFSLAGVDGHQYSLNRVRGKNGLLVMFICNHCPFVQAIAGKLAVDMKKLQKADIGVVAIMPNDTEQYPADSFDNMKVFAKHQGFTFPYLFDETQEVARAYGAVCTPDFFGFDKDLELRYRGRFDSSGREVNKEGKHELLEAMLQIGETGAAPKDQMASIGCSIKWRQVS
jgi:peroxiredoxin